MEVIDFNGDILNNISDAIVEGSYEHAVSMIKQYKAYLEGQETMASALSECTNFKGKAVQIIQDAAEKQMVFAERLIEWEYILKASYGDI